MSATSDVRYARAGDTHVAYRVLDGPAGTAGGAGGAGGGADDVEIVMVSGFNFPFETLPDDPVGARLLDGLASIGRTVIFDRRGIGLSDPVTDWERPLVDQWTDDLAAVIEAACVTRPVVFAWDVFGVARRFAIRFPDRCDRLGTAGGMRETAAPVSKGGSLPSSHLPPGKRRRARLRW